VSVRIAWNGRKNERRRHLTLTQTPAALRENLPRRTLARIQAPIAKRPPSRSPPSKVISQQTRSRPAPDFQPSRSQHLLFGSEGAWQTIPQGVKKKMRPLKHQGSLLQNRPPCAQDSFGPDFPWSAATETNMPMWQFRAGHASVEELPDGAFRWSTGGLEKTRLPQRFRLLTGGPAGSNMEFLFFTGLACWTSDQTDHQSRFGSHNVMGEASIGWSELSKYGRNTKVRGIVLHRRSIFSKRKRGIEKIRLRPTMQVTERDTEKIQRLLPTCRHHRSQTRG